MSLCQPYSFILKTDVNLCLSVLRLIYDYLVIFHSLNFFLQRHSSYFTFSNILPKFTKFPSLSRHRPLHRPMHGDDSQDDNRRPLRQCEADGLEAVSRNVFAKRGKCKRTDNQGNPSDNNGKQLSGSPRQTDCYAQLAASPQ